METSRNAMAFLSDYYRDASKLAQRFAGEEGRLATIPDIVDARLSSPIGRPAWEQYFTTHSAEYVGYSPQGNKIIVVAHGVGPLESPEGVTEAYGNQLRYRVENGSRNAGRVSNDTFQKLVKGQYGEVDIVDYWKAGGNDKFPFRRRHTVESAQTDPLLIARLGVSAQEYIQRQFRVAQDWAKTEVGVSYPERLAILVNLDSNSEPYDYVEPEDPPLANLLTITQPVRLNVNRGYASEIKCYSKTNSARIVGIRGNDYVRDIVGSVNMDIETIFDHLPLILKPNELGLQPRDFSALLQYGDKWFTQHPKNGYGRDTYEPQFVVKDLEPIKTRHQTFIKTGDNQIFTRYSVKDVHALAPEGANAYMVSGEWEYRDSHSIAPAQYFHIEADTEFYIPRVETLERDFDLLMKIAG